MGRNPRVPLLQKTVTNLELKKGLIFASKSWGKKLVSKPQKNTKTKCGVGNKNKSCLKMIITSFLRSHYCCSSVGFRSRGAKMYAKEVQFFGYLLRLYL